MSKKTKYRFKLHSEDVAILLSILEFSMKVTDNEDARKQIDSTWRKMHDQFREQYNPNK